MHAFSECNEVKPIWDWAKPYFEDILNSKNPRYLLTLGNYASTTNRDIRHAYTLTCVINYNIWHQRCKNQFENLNSNQKIRHDVTILKIKQELRRLIVSYFNIHRDSPRKFAKDFCIRSSLCQINPDLLLKTNF